MKRILLLLVFYATLGMAQETTDSLATYTACVVEEETGEPLPLVGVYISQENTTLTNFDGEFSIKALPNDTLRLTCAGRRTLRLICSSLPDTIRMEMLSGVMSEVIVRAFDGTLVQISKQMEKAFSRYKKKKSQYFYRQTSVLGHEQDIAEAFIDANSAVNLRNMKFLSGIHGKQMQSQKDQNPIIFGFMNLHHVLEIAPMTFETPFWDYMITPLVNPNIPIPQKANGKLQNLIYYQKFYHIDLSEINDNGQHIYRIDLSPREKGAVKLPMMTGTLYVDCSTLQVLAFDGVVENIALLLRRNSLESTIKIPTDLSFHIDYRYDHGYPEVADLLMQAKQDQLMTRAMLLNVGDQQYPKTGKKGRTVKENMLSSIYEVGYDSLFWSKKEIIKRTAEEQRIADGIIDEDQARSDSAKAARAALPPLERLAERLQRFGRFVPQEKVYVHMDNTGYFLGDTIWFAAYSRRTDNDQPSRISRVLYVELLNHDGYLVERKLVEMENGCGSGFFALPDTLYSGYFELRAYTRWQLNWGQTEHYHAWNTEEWFYNRAMAKDFFRDYEKLYSRVFPVYDKPKEAGDFYRDMTLRPLQRYFKSDPKPVELRLSLFPEGGNLVAGVPCRVAFEAATSEGEVREGELRLMTDEQVVTTARTENRGRGTFVFTPAEEQNYEAVFIADNDNTKQGTAQQKIKAFRPEGVALQVHYADSIWHFDITAQGQATMSPLGMTVMHEGVLEHFETLSNPTDSHISIPTAELKTGVNQVTVFDSIGHIYADRLFFVSNPELGKPTVSVSGTKEEYEPYEPIEISLASHSSPLTSLSVTIRDVQNSDHTFDSGNILTEMLLSSEIKGFVPQPEWYFEQDDEEHRRGLDLLMMTQGWRRFNWQEMAVENTWRITHPAEHTQMVTGTVNRYWTFDKDEDSPDDPLVEVRPARNPDSQANFSINSTLFDDKLATSNYPTNYSTDNLNTQNSAFNLQGNTWQNNDYNALHYKTDSQHYQENRKQNLATMHRYLEQGNLKKEVRVHAEFINPLKKNDFYVGEVETRKGQFHIDLPRFYGQCVFFLGASDTTKWSRKKQHQWVMLDTQTAYDKLAERQPDLPEYYVRLNFPYPRWVKPYSFYQVHTAPKKEEKLEKAKLKTDGIHLLDEITVRTRRGGLRHIDYSKPAYVLDAYEAANLAMDAGLLEYIDDYQEAASWAAVSLIGDMGMERNYDIKVVANQNFTYDGSGKNVGPLDGTRNHMLTFIDKIYIYTDYSPRREGDERYQQSNQPSVRIDLRKYPNNEKRVNYRDRRLMLNGFAYQEDFYHPDYQRNPPTEGQKDYRRTLYWNPDLKLDQNGQAHITLFNNSQRTTIQVDAAGQSENGTLLFTP